MHLLCRPNLKLSISYVDPGALQIIQPLSRFCDFLVNNTDRAVFLDQQALLEVLSSTVFNTNS
jgi:hypothetical protein